MKRKFWRNWMPETAFKHNTNHYDDDESGIPEYRISILSPTLLLHEPIQRHSLSPSMSYLKPLIILTTWALLAVSHMVLAFHVPIRTEFFAFRKRSDDEFGLRPSWSFRLSVALVIGYRLLSWTLYCRFCVLVSVKSWFFTW